MATLKLTLTKDILALVSNIRFKEYKKVQDDDQREHIGYEIDLNSLYGGDFVLEDISFILGLYDQHIPDTEEDADGPKFPEKLEEYMYGLHAFIVENLDNIEEIVHQMILKGGIKEGTYKCKDWQHIWEYVENKEK